MSTYQLVREQIIPRPLDEVFSFFADARNLETLTPPLLNFEILTPGTIEMQVGTIIQYALRIHGIPVHWTTAITVWNPPWEFVDVQLRGPYVRWHHRHTFESLGDSTRMVDEVNYRLPFGWLGRAMNSLLVRRDLNLIFKFRERTVIRLFDGEGRSLVSRHREPCIAPGRRSRHHQQFINTGRAAFQDSRKEVSNVGSQSQSWRTNCDWPGSDRHSLGGQRAASPARNCRTGRCSRSSH